MEGRQLRSFTDDYKRQAVDLVASSGRSVGSVAHWHEATIPLHRLRPPIGGAGGSQEGRLSTFRHAGEPIRERLASSSSGCAAAVTGRDGRSPVVARMRAIAIHFARPIRQFFIVVSAPAYTH